VGLALLSLAMLSACGVSAGNAEQAITDQSHGRLTEPECEEFDRGLGEKTFDCSAAQPGGRRIKLLVTLPEPGSEIHETLILEWPCLSAGTRWQAVRKHPALRCGKPLPKR
jgi:hypothetical protein